MCINKISKFPRKTLLLILLLMFILLYLIWSDSILLQLQNLRKKVYYLHIIDEFDVEEEWFAKQSNYCDGKFQGFGHEWAILKNVTFIANEPFTFQMTCITRNIPLQYSFKLLLQEKNHLNDWLSKVNFNAPKKHLEMFEKKTTLAVMRYEYANLYHQMTDYYNAFVLMKYLNVEPDNFNIFLIDTHPKSSLDKNWDDLFGDVLELKNVNKPIAFRNLVWSVIGYNSPINFHSLHSLSYIEEFSNFLRSRFGVSQEKKLSCSRISILFIWRRDYVAHPGNPTGKISRKIFNEKEIVEAIESELPGHKVDGIQLDKLSMEDQVKLVSQADILVGMHGAGLSHILELPSHAGVLELFPTYWGKSTQHFKALAKWRGLHYVSWQNINPNNEKPGLYTNIPSNIIVQKVNTLYNDMCSN